MSDNPVLDRIRDDIVAADIVTDAVQNRIVAHSSLLRREFAELFKWHMRAKPSPVNWSTPRPQTRCG